jgi:glutamate-1-semialdehyde 2,1-aminomutase
MPGGVNSNVRLESASWFFERGDGAWLWDVDGGDYVDYAIGMGALFLGHSDRNVIEAVVRSVERGTVYGAQHPLEIEAAESLLQAIQWADRARLGCSGSEAVHAVLRVARAATGRTKIVRFTGHYHGWLDNILVPLDATAPRPGSPGQLATAIEDLLVLPWNSKEALESVLSEHHDEIAAVIMEPIMLNSGATEPLPGYLELARELCSRYGVLLVFDEVITGFRVALGGAVQRYSVAPDLATYGKAMAGGWPVAAIAGRAEYMDLFANGVNHSGTFNGSTMACAAVSATIDRLRREVPYDEVERYGSELMSALPAIAKDCGVIVNVEGLPAAFSLTLDASPDLGCSPAWRQAAARRLHTALAEAGIWTTTRGLWFVSAAHREDDLAATLTRAAKAFDLIRPQIEDLNS